MRILASMVALAGCGRHGFDEPPGTVRDAMAGDVADGDGAVIAVDDAMATPAVDAVPVTGMASCAGIKAGDPLAADGVYALDPGGGAPFSAYCDMTTDGGGWTLVLSYVHAGGTNPATLVRTTDLPLLGGNTLGADESGSATWGHGGTAMLSRLPFSQLRFACRSSAHTRVLDFRSSSASCIAYVRSGTGLCTGILDGFAALPGHDAILPQQATHVTGDGGDHALALDPFFKNTMPKANWTISPALGWACDAQTQGSATHTIHRVWVR